MNKDVLISKDGDKLRFTSQSEEVILGSDENGYWTE